VLISAFIGVAFAWALVLSVSPRWHQQIHGDAAALGHICAVAFVVSGSCDHSAHPPLINAPPQTGRLSKIPGLNRQWVESPFLLASIFEHAPPTKS